MFPTYSPYVPTYTMHVECCGYIYIYKFPASTFPGCWLISVAAVSIHQKQHKIHHPVERRLPWKGDGTPKWVGVFERHHGCFVENLHASFLPALFHAADWSLLLRCLFTKSSIKFIHLLPLFPVFLSTGHTRLSKGCHIQQNVVPSAVGLGSLQLQLGSSPLLAGVGAPHR